MERNPVRAAMVEEAWGLAPLGMKVSARAQVDASDLTGLLDLGPRQTCPMADMPGPLWKQALEQGVEDALLTERIRLATRTSRPLGTGGFVSVLERGTGPPLTARQAGPESEGQFRQPLLAKA